MPHILIFDEDSVVRGLYRSLLEAEGYTVTLRAALPHIAEIAAMQPDAIVIDYFSRSLSTGWNFVVQVKTHRATAAIPILICTGNTAIIEAHGVELARFDVNVVYKPFNVADFVAAVHYSLAPRSRAVAQRSPYDAT